MLNLADILKASEGQLLGAKENPGFTFSGASIDSRAIKEGELFIPLKGTRSDGHVFLEQAMEKGAGALIGEYYLASGKLPGAQGKYLVLVKDTLRALQQIANHIRMKRPGMPVIGITGTNGKTTTKELTAAILSKKFSLLKSTGNLNNHIGLPLNLCGLLDSHQMCVLEMGASFPGDIKDLCRIASPTHGILTNIGQSHLEGFGSMEGLLKTKLELATASDTIIYNADDPMLQPALEAYTGKVLMSFGINKKANVRAEDVTLGEKGSSFKLRSGDDRIDITLRIPGLFNVYNALAAASAGIIFDVDFKKIAAACSSFSPVNMRYQVGEFHGALVLNDVYNANPASMRESIRELARLRENRKGKAIAVLGDMLELGEYSKDAHREIGKLLKELRVDIFIAAGPMMTLALEEFKGNGNMAIACPDSTEAGNALVEKLDENDTVLIKGSRGMKMEKVLEGRA